MSGRKRNDENEGEGGGWASTFWKVAGATAATVVVAGGLYIALKKPESEPVAVGGSSSGKEKSKKGWVKLNVDGTLRREIKSAGCKIRKLLLSPPWEEIKLIYIGRAANQIADKVADNAHRLPDEEDFKEYGPNDIPDNCRALC